MMRTIFLIGLMGSLALGCGDDDAGFDGGPGRDAGPRADAGPSVDAGPGTDGGGASDVGPGADTGPAVDTGAVADTGPMIDGGPDAGPEADAGGAGCGGLAGIECMIRGEFCDFEMGCGVDDRMGMCVIPPESCPRILDPVCGCDGNDYGNPCMAQMARQSVARAGRCEATRCGGRGGVACDANEYCAYERIDMCGRTDASSTCMTRPRRCEDIFRPVCGCDGSDYGNECEANSAGVAVLHNGPCDEP